MSVKYIPIEEIEVLERVFGGYENLYAPVFEKEYTQEEIDHQEIEQDYLYELYKAEQETISDLKNSML